MFKVPNCNGRRGRKGRPSSWRWIQIEGLASFRRDGASDAPFPSFGDIYRTGDLAARGAGCAERVSHRKIWIANWRKKRFDKHYYYVQGRNRHIPDVQFSELNAHVKEGSRRGVGLE